MIATYIGPSGSNAGLVAAYHSNADLTYANSANTIINFNTQDYDPDSLVTTGASWKFTAAAAAWYDIHLEQGWVDPNSNTYAAGTGNRIDLYRNTTDSIAALADGGVPVTTIITTHYMLLHGQLRIELDIADTIDLHFINYSGQTRKLLAGAGIAIYRMT